MTSEQRRELLLEMIFTLGELGCIRSQRSVIMDLAAEHGATTPAKREPRPESWERAVSEYELYRAQSGASRDVA